MSGEIRPETLDALDDLIRRAIKNARVAHAARAFVSSAHVLDGASGTGALSARYHHDAAYHDLCLAVDGDCSICDDGTCPGSILAGDRRLYDVVDTKPL